jgi:hypothetical protein
MTGRPRPLTPSTDWIELQAATSGRAAEEEEEAKVERKKVEVEER